jgi:hypothetical protein
MKTVYHGSYIEINEVDLSKCRVGRDFGQGFYVTCIRAQAEHWAKKKGSMKGGGVVTEFEFDEELCDVMDLSTLHFDGYTEEWLDFVIPNRANKTRRQTHYYDVVEGPVADDDIATRIGDYLAGSISKEQFLKDLIYKEPSHQICFCTIQSLQTLVLQKGKIDSVVFHADNNILQALMTDFGLSEREATDVYYKSATCARLSDETSGLYQQPWPEIYQMLQCELKNNNSSSHTV